MGYEQGTIFIYDKKFWLFSMYSTDKEMYQTLVLHGLNGEVIEVRESECFSVLSPSEFDYDELEKLMS